MPRFHPLKVTDIRKTIRDAVIVSLEPTDGADFSFQQGQYLTFRRDFDGTELRRSYSICVGRDEKILQVGIKHVAGGAFSTWANETLEPGMILDAMPPMGNFHAPLDPAASRSYLGFAGGSGITPVLSILKTVLAEEPLSHFTLIYANRAVNTIMFREELEDLKNTYMGRLTLIHILETDAQEIDLFTGRVDAEKCAALFKHWIDIASVDLAFICGPEPMMLGIAASLKDHGLSEDQIKFELFAAGQPGQLERKATPEEAPEKTTATALTLTLDGATRHIEIAPGQSLLEAALDNAMDAPFACKAGVCSTCKCKLLAGEVEMRTNHALEDYEVEDGYVLACQSYPVTDKIEADFDQ